MPENRVDAFRSRSSCVTPGTYRAIRPMCACTALWNEARAPPGCLESSETSAATGQPFATSSQCSAMIARSSPPGAACSAAAASRKSGAPTR
jgi:hypothetical protein